MNYFIILLLILNFGIQAQNLKTQTPSDLLDEFLRNRIEAAGMPPQITVGQELIYASVMLPRFYERRAYQPAWINRSGPLPQAAELIRAIGLASLEGLRPYDYHLNKIESTLAEIKENQRKKRLLSPSRLIDLDLLLTDAFLIYGSHLLAGRINPETIDSEWFANRREADLAEILQNALDSNGINAALRSLLPPQPGYGRLKDALARYRRLASNEDWPPVPQGPKLQLGDQNSRVMALRKRLVLTGDLQSERVDSDLFGHQLSESVRRFQRRHGLEVDGTVDSATLNTLNISIAERICQIEVNLERWRWLPQDLGRRYILVNIANFELDVVEDGQLAMVMPVIVGREYRRTPVFSDKMTYLVLCPYWHVPNNIAIQDKLPLIRRDSTYLSKQKMRVFEGWGSEARELDPNTIDWSKVSAKNFPYRLRQDPGPNNALGRIKFMFPNRFNVYLHDTPSRELFTKTVRTFSSGCIRIKKPVELAEYVLRDDPKWARETIEAAINKWQEQTVRLPEPIPVHLLYWTAWADLDGTIHFRNDVYGRDKPLYEALGEEPPGT